MNNLAIRALNLRKVYRLYTRPHYRVLDVFGLLRRSEGAYTEHVALADVNIDIRRGEKVALVGRNGAGKSTLLKLVTGVTEPTSGHIEVFGKTQALLQIGTGFHPDFTGRQNVFSYLAHLGVTGKDAERRLHEIVEFAELEEYIDQPVKTYSTGMGIRLMFATSTVITPDILVLDEVLGVGDAYFARKSYERIRELCKGHGTTLLLVTHDIYSASRICDRMIWINHGRVVMDAGSSAIVLAYEDSIREQEEFRLRKKKLEQLRIRKGHPTGADAAHVLLEIRSQHNRPQPCPVYFSRVSLLIDGQRIDSLPLGPEATQIESGTHLLTEGTTWGEPIFWQGRQSRSILNYGSTFHKVAGVFGVPAYLLAPGIHTFQVILDYWSEVPCNLSLALYHKDTVLDLGLLPTVSGQWLQHTSQLQGDLGDAVFRTPVNEINVSGQQGTGVITVSNVKCVNARGQEMLFFLHGESVEFHVAYQINKPDLRERTQVLIQLHRDGVQDVCRFITRDLLFDAAQQRSGIVVARLPRLPLAEGTYTVTVMIVKEGYYDSEQSLFYTINPDVYACLGRTLEIVVQKGGIVGNGTAVVIDAEWSLLAGSPAYGIVADKDGNKAA